jgi:hypothetical protein
MYTPQSDRDVLPPSVHHLSSSSLGDVGEANASGSGSEHGNMKISKPSFLLRKPDKMHRSQAWKDIP